jgi:hypothetical protein
MADLLSAVNIVRPGQAFQSGAVDALFLAEYGGMVEGTIAAMSIMESWIDWRPVRGTNTLTNYRVGETQLAKLTPGSSPNGGGQDVSNVSVKVDTVVLARNSVFTLDDLQNRFDAKQQLALEQGKTVAKFMDQMGLIKLAKAARIVAGDGTGGTTKLPSGWYGGTQTTLASASDEKDAVKLERAIEDTVQGINEKDLDPTQEGFKIFALPEQYFTLLRNDKLVDDRYSLGNGDYAEGKVLKSCGLPVAMTNRIPKAAITGHMLSNASNGSAYDVSATEAKSVVIIGAAKAILAGTTIPLSTNVWWDDASKCYFIDTWFAVGAGENNPAYSAVINKA